MTYGITREPGRGSEPAGLDLEPARRALKSAERALKPAERALLPAETALELVWRALKPDAEPKSQLGGP